MSKIEVNTVDVQCGSTLTLGSSGKTVQIACGATTVGMGRTGTVDWQTTPKTSTFTAVNGEGYFINSGSAITMNLPAGSAGAIVSVSDYARNFSTYNFTISANGSEKIGGVTEDAKLDVNGDGQVTIDDVKLRYNCSKHPDVVAGRKTENEVLGSFMSLWDTQEKDGIVTIAEFTKYYSDISASVDDDEMFALILINAWNLGTKK